MDHSQPYDVSQATELGWYSTANTISYTNASVGVHPYNTVSGDGGCTSSTSCAPYIARLSAVQAAGYPVIMTELITLTSGAPDQQLLSALDGIGVSWAWFDFTGVWTTGSGPCSTANTCGNPHNEALNVYWTQDPNLGTGGTSQFTATATYANGFSDSCNTVGLYGYTCAWVSGTPATGTITSGGLFTAVAAGTSAVTASAGGVTSPATTMTVTSASLTSIALSTAGGISSLSVNASNQLTATCTYSDSTHGQCSPASWLSSSPGVASVSSSGLVNALTVGSTNLTATIGSVTSPALALSVNNAGVTLSTLPCKTLAIQTPWRWALRCNSACFVPTRTARATPAKVLAAWPAGPARTPGT